MFVTPSHYKNILREQEALRKENRELRVENDTLVGACKYCREVINNKAKTRETKLATAKQMMDDIKECKLSMIRDIRNSPSFKLAMEVINKLHKEDKK